MFARALSIGCCAAVVLVGCDRGVELKSFDERSIEEEVVDDWPIAWTALESEILIRVNQLRARGTRCGQRVFAPQGPLASDVALRRAARLHSKDMAGHDYFSHSGRDGSGPFQRMRDAGYAGEGLSENIAAGGKTANDTFELWRTSPGHCANMMSPDANEIGIGYAEAMSSKFGSYWTQTFGNE